MVLQVPTTTSGAHRSPTMRFRRLNGIVFGLVVVGSMFSRVFVGVPLSFPPVGDMMLTTTTTTVEQPTAGAPIIRIIEQPMTRNDNENEPFNRRQSNPPHNEWQSTVPDTMNCSWRRCLKKNHNCSSFCRDSIDDFGTAPAAPDNWIPDVTMLHRMMLAGKDADGRTWPPRLDSELCDDIGTDDHSTTNRDVNHELFQKIPLEATPLSPSEKTPKIMCMVYSMEVNHATTIRAMRETWAPYCDGFLVFSTASDPRIPAISIPHDGPEDYKNMWQKVRSILKFVGTHYLDDFDFFFQGGDDLFVIPQNLKRYLKKIMDQDNKTPEDDYFVGRRFKREGVYFNSGGAGYALSRGTLRKYVHGGWDHPNCSPRDTTSMEDVMIAQCLLNVFGIGLTDTRDHELRERFHPFSPDTHYLLRSPGGRKFSWYFTYNQEWPVLLEEMCCSPESVSFHYIKNPAMVRHLYALINTCDR